MSKRPQARREQHGWKGYSCLWVKLRNLRNERFIACISSVAWPSVKELENMLQGTRRGRDEAACRKKSYYNAVSISAITYPNSNPPRSRPCMGSRMYPFQHAKDGDYNTSIAYLTLSHFSQSLLRTKNVGNLELLVDGQDSEMKWDFDNLEFEKHSWKKAVWEKTE